MFTSTLSALGDRRVNTKQIKLYRLMEECIIVKLILNEILDLKWTTLLKNALLRKGFKTFVRVWLNIHVSSFNLMAINCFIQTRSLFKSEEVWCCFQKKIRIYENMKKDFIYMFAIYGSLIHKQKYFIFKQF